MASFAIICEGISENRALHAIIDKYCIDAYFADIQPKLHNAGNHHTQANWGGWSEVLSHCNTETFTDALAQNDYLVVQVDTDSCDQKGFDVPSSDAQGQARRAEDVYKDIVARLLQDVDPQLVEDNNGRILFAICFNEIECWFLPLFYSNNHKCATHNCIFLLNKELEKKDNSYKIPDTDKNNDQARRSYQFIFKQLKRKNIADVAQYNYGFMKFVENLEATQACNDDQDQLTI